MAEATDTGGLTLEPREAREPGYSSETGGFSVERKGAPPEKAEGLVVPGAAALVNFLDYPFRAVAADLYGITPGTGPFKQAKAASLQATEIPEGPWSKAATAVLNTPGQVVGDIAGSVGKRVLGEKTAKAVEPYVEVAGDVASAVGGARGLTGRTYLTGEARVPSEYRQAVDMLRESDVPLTPGQMAGGATRYLEQMGHSVPITGIAIRAAEARSIQGFNRGAYNHVLENIGLELPADVAPGEAAVRWAGDAIGQEYQRIYQNATFQISQNFAQGVTGILQNAAGPLAPAQVAQLRGIIGNRVVSRLQPNGMMTGPMIQQVRSEIRAEARNYRSSADASQRNLGHALEEVDDAIGDQLERQNPNMARDINAADRAYAMLVRVEGAASRRVGSMGVFTPADLLSSIRSNERTVRRRGFARGEGLMQEYATAGQRVLPSTLPNSFSAERGAHMILGRDVAAGAVPGAVLPLAIGMTPWSRLAVGGANRLYDTGTLGPATRALAPIAIDPRTGLPVQQ